jgi:hypothetical protein
MIESFVAAARLPQTDPHQAAGIGQAEGGGNARAVANPWRRRLDPTHRLHRVGRAPWSPTSSPSARTASAWARCCAGSCWADAATPAGLPWMPTWRWGSTTTARPADRSWWSASRCCGPAPCGPAGEGQASCAASQRHVDPQQQRTHQRPRGHQPNRGNPPPCPGAVAAGQPGVGGQPGQGQGEHRRGDIGDRQATDSGVLQPQRRRQQADHHVPPGAATADRQADGHHHRRRHQPQLPQQRDGEPAAPHRCRHRGAGRADQAAGQLPTSGGANLTGRLVATVSQGHAGRAWP